MTTPLIRSLATSTPMPAAPAPAPAAAPQPPAAAPQDQVSIGQPQVTVSTSAAPAAAPPAAPPAAPKAAPQLSGLGKLLHATGNVMAKIGLFGGLAIGGGLGFAATLAMGGTGLALPLVGAVLLGFEGADAHAAQQALNAGPKSLEYQTRLSKNRSMTPMSSASHILSLAAGSAAFGLGLGVIGGTTGMLVSVASSLALAGTVIFAASKAEKAVLAAS